MEAWRWRQSLLFLVAFQMALGHAAAGTAILLVLVIGELVAGERLWPATPLDAGLLGFLLVAAVSAFLSPWQGVALTGVILLGGAACVIVRATTLSSLRSPIFGEWFLSLWGLGGVVAAAVAITTFGRGLDARAELPGLGYNALGTMLATALVVLVGLSAAGSRARRAVHLVGVPVVAAALVLTFSRGAWLAAACGIGTLLVAGRSRAVLAGVVVIALVLTASVAIVAPRWRWHTERLVDVAGRGDRERRLSIWRIVPTIVRAHPLVGTGLGTFPFVYAQVTGNDAATDPVPFAHNIVLNAAVETGLGGLVALVLLLGAGFRAGIRWHGRCARGAGNRVVSATALAALVAMLSHQMVDGTVMGVHVAIGVFALLGLAAAGDLSTRPRQAAR